MSWRRKIYKNARKLYAANVQLRIDDRPPVLVYQMGKVGSSSIRDSLWAEDDLGPVFHLHWFYPWREKDATALPLDGENQYRAVEREIAQEQRAFEGYTPRKRLRRFMLERWYYAVIHKQVIEKPRPAKVVTMVRDPVSTNVSMFFQAFDEYAGARFEKARYSTNEIIDIFEKRYLLSWPLTWFDKEMKPMLGIDIYRYPFPRKRGHRVVKKGNYEMLVLKCELSDARKRKAVADFLDLENFEITRRNESKNKDYAAYYREFKKRVYFPEKALEKLCRSKYARHFYTERELTRVRKRWSRVRR